jgi:hypothetical protein
MTKSVRVATAMDLSFIQNAEASQITNALCYSGCTFEGQRKARQTCEIAVDAINKLSNSSVQLVASCQINSKFCQGSSACIFSDVALVLDMYTH